MNQLMIRTVLVCSLMAAVIFGLSLHKIEPLPVSGAPLQFDAQQSYTYMSQLAAGFPNRVTWGESRHKAENWVKEEFHKLGYEPQTLRFSEMIAGKEYTDLENVYAEKRGTRYPDQIIVMMAHYDIVDTTEQGAMDDASGVGIVLELARIFAHEQTNRTMIFLITDSEEYGAFWGARSFAHYFDRANQIIAAPSFDFVAPEKQTRIITLCDGLKTGYTPLWLRELALNSITGVKAVDMSGPLEFIERAMQIPASDHGAMLAAGIPSFNWVGQTDNFTYEMAHYHHTPYDRVEALRPESFDAYGKSAERLVRSIDALYKVPSDYRNSSYWKISRRFYIDGWAALLLHILAFIPFLAYSGWKCSSILKKRPHKRVWEICKNEAKSLGIVAGALLLGYAVILTLPALRVITQYETFPATQKSALLYNPDFTAMLAVLAAVVAVYWIFKRAFRAPEDSIGAIEIRHAFHAVLLAGVILLAFLKNSYLAVLLLLPPAYLWTALRARRRTGDRVLNGLLLLGGAVTFVTMAIVLSTVFHVGVVYWYMFLAAAYGLISVYATVLFLIAFAVMIRLFLAFVA